MLMSFYHSRSFRFGLQHCRISHVIFHKTSTTDMFLECPFFVCSEDTQIPFITKKSLPETAFIMAPIGFPSNVLSIKTFCRQIYVLKQTSRLSTGYSPTYILNTKRKMKHKPLCTRRHVQVVL